MYEIYSRILKEKGLKSADVARGISINASVLSDWKNGKSVPKTETMKKIADYLGVSLNYLLNGEKEKEQIFTTENAVVIAKIAMNPALLASVDKLLSLSEKKQKHVMELIDLLSE